MAATDWGRYGITPSGDPKTRRFQVTAPRGVTIGGQHYPKGAELPRRQGENLRLAVDRSDWASWSEWQQARAGRGRFHDYPSWVEQGAKGRRRPQARQRDDPAFNRAYLRWVRRGRPRSSNPNGLLARMLVEAGKRDQGATYKVGRSPGYKGKGHHRRAAA